MTDKNSKKKRFSLRPETFFPHSKSCLFFPRFWDIPGTRIESVKKQHDIRVLTVLSFFVVVFK